MELYELTVTEARKGLQEKKFSSSELTSACLERVRAVEPKLHAFVTLTEAQALEQARKADLLLGSGEVRPLLGVGQKAPVIYAGDDSPLPPGSYLVGRSACGRDSSLLSVDRWCMWHV